MSKIIFILLSIGFSSECFSHGITEEAKLAMINGGYLQYLILGAEHMITGYDHILFLVGVVFFLTGFKDILKFVTIFTLGHSITLLSATFMGISANYWLVDAVIALSVIYKGFDNNNGFVNYLGMKKAPNLLGVVFTFGLIHGFGLSTRLQQLPLGEKGLSMFNRIASFNIGVELGQITALCIILFVLARLRKFTNFSIMSKVVNHGLMMAGFLLFLMQMHGYLHVSDVDEFGFSEDNHSHHHEKINNNKKHINTHESL